VQCEFLGLESKVLDCVGFTSKAFVGKVGVRGALVLDAAVFVAISSHMEPSEKGFHVGEEEERRECATLESASFNRYSVYPPQGNLICLVASS